jgi:type IV pilus assembly protein PilA
MKTLREQLKDEGFTLIELLIVMSIMLILITLAVPQYKKVRKQVNETSAITSLKAISTAQKQYDSGYGDIGYSCTMQALGGDPSAGAPSAQAAQMLDPKLALTQVKDGYKFNITCKKTPVGNTERVTGYQVTAEPVVIGSTGDRGYCMDDNDLIKYDMAGGTNCTQSQ